MPKKKIITLKQRRFIQKNYLKMSNRALSLKTGISETIIQKFKKNNGLIVPKEVSRRFASETNSKRTTSTPEVDKIIKAEYLTTPTKNLAIKIGRSSTFVKCRVRQLGLTIPKELRTYWRETCMYKKGVPPVNKGKKQSEFMTPEGIEKTKATRFKKGNIPPNTKKEGDGAISIRADKSGRRYYFQRVSQGVWVPVHRLRWEEVNGQVPAGMIVAFKDGNSLNPDYDNLELITRAENMVRNSIYKLPAELISDIRVVAGLNRRIKNKIKKYATK